VAAVTAGFGDLMKPVFQDVRPVGMPEGQVEPEDLDALRFNVVLRGYKMAEVDAVLRRMSRELAQRDAVLAELRGTGRTLRQDPAAVEDRPTELLAAYADPDAPVDEPLPIEAQVQQSVEHHAEESVEHQADEPVEHVEPVEAPPLADDDTQVI